MSTAPRTFPLVQLPRPAAEIEGRQVEFVPIHDGFDQVTIGNAHIFISEAGISVGANYISPGHPPQPAVYWFNQAEINALFKD